jgi:cytochrome P450
VLKEALRRYSVVPVVTRSLKEDDMLGGQPVPAGAMIVCHVQVCADRRPITYTAQDARPFAMAAFAFRLVQHRMLEGGVPSLQAGC